jgi:SAM-dependent methyltransferase
VPDRHSVDPPPAKGRFRSNDRYRAEREWARYEGTPQRDLFLELRRRFVRRHRGRTGWALDAGSGPGRFLGDLGNGPAERRVALDIGREMLELLEDRWPRGAGVPSAPERVRADAVRPPFLDQAFGLVAALGNLVGFAGRESGDALRRLARLVTPGGTLLVEIAPGPGERSQYLARLPPTSVARLLRSPVRAVLPRVGREGFRTEPARKSAPGEFRRFTVEAVHASLGAEGFRVDETVAVAPMLGPDPARIAAVASDATSWNHLLDAEEAVGRLPARWPTSAAVLIAAVRGPSPWEGKSSARTSKSEG